MGKMVLGLLLLAVAPGWVLAENKPNPEPIASENTAVLVPSEKSLSGKVKSVSVADMAKGTKSEIVLADASGKKTEVLITPTTTLYDADAQAITLEKIAVKDKINVIYTTSPEDVNEAKLVKVIK